MPPQSGGSEAAGCMKRKPSIRSLETVTVEESMAYLDHASGDELNAAYALAWDRNRLDGSLAPPDDAEVHHALFLLCRARGKTPPSFDELRVELRRRGRPFRTKNPTRVAHQRRDDRQREGCASVGVVTGRRGAVPGHGRGAALCVREEPGPSRVWSVS